MKKDIILGIILVLITSCASRKVDIVKNNTKSTIDSSAVVKTDSVSTINNNIITTENLDEIEVIPVVDSIPMVINGITYKNAIVRHKKQNKVIVDTSKINVLKNTSKIIQIKKEDKRIALDKHVKKEANYFIYLWLLLIPIGMYIYRQIKRKIFL
jgi:hypothetical protein